MGTYGCIIKHKSIEIKIYPTTIYHEIHTSWIQLKFSKNYYPWMVWRSDLGDVQISKFQLLLLNSDIKLQTTLDDEIHSNSIRFKSHWIMLDKIHIPESFKSARLNNFIPAKPTSKAKGSTRFLLCKNDIMSIVIQSTKDHQKRPK